MRASVQTLALPLRHTFRIARSATDVAETMLLTIEHEGIVARGEGHPTTYYGESVAEVRRALETFARWAVEEGAGQVVETARAIAESTVGAYLEASLAVERLFELLPEGVKNYRSALAAIDIAVHDLAGQLADRPLWRLLGADPTMAPATSFTIAIASLEEMVRRVGEAEHYPILKIKLGTRRDVEVVRAVRAATDKVIRLDANAAWSTEEAIEVLRALDDCGIELVEQPVAPGDAAAMRRVREAVPVPIFADESCVVPPDVEALAGVVDGVNIKLSKCGGLARAARMVARARELGLRVMIGCFIESSVGIGAAAHLSPLADVADLDGNLLIVEEPFQGVELDASARPVLTEAPGLGVRA